MKREIEEALEWANEPPTYLITESGNKHILVLANGLREALANIEYLTPKALENEALREKLRVMGAEKDRHQQICALGSCDRERELLKERDILAMELGIAEEALINLSKGNRSPGVLQIAKEALSKIREEARP